MDRRGDRRYPPRFSPAGFERAGVNHTYSLEVIRLFRARMLADDDGDPGPAAPSRCTHDLDLRLPPARSTARSVEDRSERYERTDVPCGGRADDPPRVRRIIRPSSRASARACANLNRRACALEMNDRRTRCSSRRAPTLTHGSRRARDVVPRPAPSPSARQESCSHAPEDPLNQPTNRPVSVASATAPAWRHWLAIPAWRHHLTALHAPALRIGSLASWNRTGSAFFESQDF